MEFFFGPLGVIPSWILWILGIHFALIVLFIGWMIHLIHVPGGENSLIENVLFIYAFFWSPLTWLFAIFAFISSTTLVLGFLAGRWIVHVTL